MRHADLHLHTFHSDGTRSPREVVELARAHELQIIAISDHDNIAAYHEALGHAREAGIALIAATELSVTFEDIDLHLLAYAFDPHSQELAGRLETFRRTRATRIDRMVERLAGLGFEVSIERVRELAGDGSMGRPHVARALVEAGHCSDLDDAFARLIGTSRPAWVPKARFDLDEALSLVHRLGGLTSVAHPTLYRNHVEVVNRALDHGVDAIEVLHPEVTSEWQEYYERLALDRGVFTTGGSDDHGEAKMRQTIGTVRVPESRIAPILHRITV